MRFKLSILFTMLLISVQGFGQSTFVLKGVITDAKTQQVMPFATVFFAGSTFGTTTNDKGEYLLRVDKAGSYDLIVKFIGYETYAAQLRLGDAEVSILNVTLNSDARDLGTVVVVAKKNAKWKVYLEEFKRVFLGESINALNCKILNEQELDFTFNEETSQLEAFSDEPVIVENKELGYKVKYYLEQFVVDYETNLSGYYGFTIFEESIPKNQRKARVWATNRKKAYNGSATHFFSALSQDKLRAEGFVVGLAEILPDGNMKLDEEDVDFYELLKDTSLGKSKVLSFENYLSITYNKELESQRYMSIRSNNLSQGLTVGDPRKNPQQSWISILEGYEAIEFEANGFVINPTSFYSLGYWGFEKVAEMVPIDYLPELDN